MSSLAKAAVATGLLLLTLAYSFQWWVVLCYALLLGFGYAHEFSERRAVRMSFITAALLGLLGCAALMPPEVGDASLPTARIVFFLVFFTVEFILFGLMNLLFKERQTIYGIAHTMLFFGIGAWVLHVSGSVMGQSSLLGTLFPVIASVAIALLSYEYFAFVAPAFRARLPALAVTLGLMAGQLSLLLRFLPLGLVNAAVLFALILSLSRDALSAHVTGTLTPAFIFRSLTLLTVIFVLVLAFSKWSL